MNVLNGSIFMFDNNYEDENVFIVPGVDKRLNIPSVNFGTKKIIYVNSLRDLGVPIAGVITLSPNTLYYIINAINLLGSRLVLGSDTSLQGCASRIGSLTSTGLANGIPLISTIYGTDIVNLTIFGVHTAIEFISSNPFYFINFQNLNIFGVPNIGLISGYVSVIGITGGFTNCSGLRFDGGMSWVSFQNFLITNQVSGTGACIKIESTAVFDNKFSLASCNIKVNTGEIGVLFDTGANIRNSGYILNQNHFSGTGTYISGVMSNDNKAQFDLNTGISNTRASGGFYLSAQLATVLVQNVWTKALGTTVAYTINSKFSSIINNRIVYTGFFTEIFTVHISISLIGTNNVSCNAGLSLNGANPTAETVMSTTLDGGTRGLTVSNTFYQQLSTNNYLEVWIRNNTSSSNITAIQINVAIGL